MTLVDIQLIKGAFFAGAEDDIHKGGTTLNARDVRALASEASG